MRIQDSCVSSEDIKTIIGSNKILYCQSLGFSPWLLDERGNEIGLIKTSKPVYLGDDIIIKEIIVFDNEELSNKLTTKYKSKILIMSEINDNWW